MKIFVVICVLNLINCSGALSPEEEPNCRPPLTNIKVVLSTTHVTLQCKFFSTQLTWTFNGKNVAEANLKYHINKENITLHSPIHLGYYRCFATPCVQAFFLAPVINPRPATTAQPEKITKLISTAIATTATKGTEEIIYFSNFTTNLLLNCSCSNSLISWFANNTFCKAFFQGTTLYSAKLELCNTSTPSNLTLLPPFVAGRYFCIGAGGHPCQRHWKLVFRPTLVLPTSADPTLSPTPNFWLEYSGLIAFTLFLLCNLFLINFY
ncbi:CR1-alpha protein [Human adenovirus 18]|uniref:CR1-alpha protein n=1 Tax=Human adenovirus A serotype 18 TaxID=10528 RepID=D3JIT8_ADE18|nr:CR1-alpha protein [Human adenovirus 18]